MSRGYGPLNRRAPDPVMSRRGTRLSLAGPLGCVALIAMQLSCSDRPSSKSRDAEAAPQARSAISEPVDANCVLPSAPVTQLEDNGVVLRVWSFTLEDVHSRPVLPDASGLLAYRQAVRARGADVRHPVLNVPDQQTPAEAEMWRDEQYNNDLAYSGAVGSIDPISCLDALLFAEQDSRISQLVRPSEFLASVLRRRVADVVEVVVVFGAGEGMFPPKSAYGLDVVDEYLAQGWSYWYVLHNHPLQATGDLGIPVPSTVDVQFVRSLAEDKGLASVRVTNGFYTFDATVNQLAQFRAR